MMFTMTSETARHNIFHANDSASPLAKVKLRLGLPVARWQIGCRGGERLPNNLPGSDILLVLLFCFNPRIRVFEVSWEEKIKSKIKGARTH